MLLLSCFVACVGSPSQTVVYDNTTTYLHTNQPLLPEWRNDSAELGDEVVLAGTAREVVELKLRLWYRGSKTGSCDMRVRLRGLKPNPLPNMNPHLPGDVLYDSGILKAQPTVSGMNEYKFAIPHVKVPDRFVWTIQAYNRRDSVGEIGLPYYNPPTVGSSDDYFWHSDMESPWIPYSWTGYPVANFAARISAVGARSDR
jgi:hypothetical protein